MCNENDVVYAVTNKGILLVSFYETLQEILPEEQLTMELWDKFLSRFIELGGQI